MPLYPPSSGFSGAHTDLTGVTATQHHSNANDHANTNDPSSGEKAALAGTSGTPGSGNKFVTDGDTRNTNARTPSAHATSHKSGGSDSIKLNEFAAPTSDVDLNSKKLTSVADPTLAQDAVTKAYGDANYGASLTNPMTTPADLIVGGTGGTPARLAKGSDNQVLTVDPTTHLLVWANSASGFADPMTSRGDTIIRDASNVTARLGIGSANKVLHSDGTDITWQSLVAADLPSAIPTISNAIVATDQTLSGNNSWVDLATVGPSVTATVGASGVVKVTLTCRMTNVTGGSYQGMGVDLSGANTVAATITKALIYGNDVPDSMASAVFLLTGLAAGATTFKAKYNQFGGGGTSHFLNREIIVEIW